jgi:hypothetical protein
VRKATDLSEVAGLPNRGENMRRYVPDASVAPLNRLGAEPDQAHSEPDGLQPDANRSAFALSRSPELLAALLRVFVLTGEDLAGVTRSQVAVRWLITAVTVAFTILLIVAGNAYASPDKDGDGIRNNRDTCLKVANPEQDDLDSDGRGDACDSDRDGDRVANTSDQCPGEPGPSSNNGCPVTEPPPPPDSDGDGVVDADDQCPDEPGPVSNNGCPELPPPPAGDGGFVAGSGAATTNRDAFLKLSGTCNNVMLPPGTYYLDNAVSKPFIEVRGYCGTFTMQEGAQIRFVDPEGGGVKFSGGTGAEFYNWTSYHPATVRDPLDDAIGFFGTTNTLINGAEIDGAGAAGILLWETTRSTVQNTYVHHTMADGIHCANAQDCNVINTETYWTGDDGIAWVRYAGLAGNGKTGGYANFVTSTESAARGISVVGQSNVRVDNFTIRNSWSGGVHVSCEHGVWNDCVNYPVENVTFKYGQIVDAGRSHRGTGPNPDSIFVHDTPNRNIVMSDIQSWRPVRDCYHTMGTGSATLINVVGDGAGC